MTRVKSVSARNHRKTLKAAKGFKQARRRRIKTAKEAVLHAGQYAFAGRRLRKRDMRRLWITRISAALKQNGLKYNEFIHKLQTRKLVLDRKILAHLALDFPKIFDKLAQEIKK